MFDEHRRPWGRLFYLLAFVVVGLTASWAQTPATTTISEVRWTDFGWGQDNDRNLAGRFSTQTFTLDAAGRGTELLPAAVRQLRRRQDIRRYTTALHLKYPLRKTARTTTRPIMPTRGGAGRQSLVMRVTDSDFQGEVLEKLGRLEAKMDMLVGSGQPGRVKLVEDRVTQLEKSEIRRGVYDRIVNAAITAAISAAIALHDRWGFK